jgi:imidazole glycerol-phosphate synthase subunit HisH
MSRTADVTLVDYGAGNLRSLRAAFRRLGASAETTSDAGAVARARRVVVPGVGSARAAMARLERDGTAAAIARAAREGTPTLGICLGLQLLFERSEEGDVPALGLLSGEVRRMGWASRLPHMGWNDVEATGGHPLADALPAVCYFAHSYAAVPAEEADVAGATPLDGRPVPAVVAHGGVVGIQFHPERSADAGRRLLERWLDWSADAA